MTCRNQRQPLVNKITQEKEEREITRIRTQRRGGAGTRNIDFAISASFTDSELRSTPTEVRCLHDHDVRTGRHGYRETAVVARRRCGGTFRRLIGDGDCGSGNAGTARVALMRSARPRRMPPDTWITELEARLPGSTSPGHGFHSAIQMFPVVSPRLKNSLSQERESSKN